MASVSMVQPTQFTTDDAKLALMDILGAFHQPENARRVDEARDKAGNDMLRVMQIVFPVTTQIQLDIIQKYGFAPDGDGIIRFAQTVKLMERQDREVQELNAQLHAIVMPQMMAPAPKTGPS